MPLGLQSLTEYLMLIAMAVWMAGMGRNPMGALKPKMQSRSERLLSGKQSMSAVGA